MPPMADNIRAIISILVGFASIIVAILIAILYKNIWFWIRQLVTGAALGRRPGKKPWWVWVAFGLSIFIAVVGGSVVTVVPKPLNPINGSESVEEFLESDPLNSPLLKASITPSFAAIPSVVPPFASATDTKTYATEVSSITPTTSSEVSNILNVISIAKESDPISGPYLGSFTHQNNGRLEVFLASAKLRDFVTEATFNNPYSLLRGTWDFGFVFRSSGFDQQLRLAITSERIWYLFDRSPEGDFLIQSGDLLNLDIEIGGSNKILLAVANNSVYLFINDQFVSRLNLSSRVSKGSIFIAIGFFRKNELPGEVTEYESFNLWQFP